jgi:hypothetical protein
LEVVGGIELADVVDGGGGGTDDEDEDGIIPFKGSFFCDFFLRKSGIINNNL